MAGLLPNEGESLLLNLLLKQSDVDRGTDLELLLFTNGSVSETTTAASLTEPTGGGYARKTLTDASWTVSGDTATYSQQVFAPTGGDYTGTIHGYAVITKGTTPRIIALDFEPTVLNIVWPITLIEGYSLKITPKITGA